MEKQEVGRVREKTGRRKKIREEKGRRKKIQVEKSQNTVFPMFWSSGGSAGAEPSGEMRDAKLHTAVKMHKTPHCQRTFGSSDLQKCTPLWRKHMWKSKCQKHGGFGPEHFWKFRKLSKSARRCGEKHISQSK